MPAWKTRYPFVLQPRGPDRASEIQLGLMSWVASNVTLLLHWRRYDTRVPSIEIDPELNRLALAEATRQYPEFAGHALHVIARPLLKGFAWQVEWKIAPPPWEFQNTAIRTYKRLAKISE
jgi:hypothetical protein